MTDLLLMGVASVCCPFQRILPNLTRKQKALHTQRADPESSSCQREGLVAVLRTRPEVRENHGTMSAWDAKVAFGVRLASQYPIQL